MKRSAILIGTSVLALCIGQRCSPSSEIEGWQTYRNATYGYEIQYPAGFAVWPTGPEGERDGRTIRIGRREYAAPAPVLDVQIYARTPSTDSLDVITSPDMDVTVGNAEINGVAVREVTYRWKVNGEIAFVRLYLHDLQFLFHANPGLHDLRATVWWKIISTFRFLDG